MDLAEISQPRRSERIRAKSLLVTKNTKEICPLKTTRKRPARCKSLISNHEENSTQEILEKPVEYKSSIKRKNTIRKSKTLNDKIYPCMLQNEQFSSCEFPFVENEKTMVNLEEPSNDMEIDQPSPLNKNDIIYYQPTENELMENELLMDGYNVGATDNEKVTNTSIANEYLYDLKRYVNKSSINKLETVDDILDFLLTDDNENELPTDGEGHDVCPIDNEEAAEEFISNDDLYDFQSCVDKTSTNKIETVDDILDFLLTEDKEESSEVIDDTLNMDIFDKTFCSTIAVPPVVNDISNYRDFYNDFNPNFQVYEQLDQKPGKSCIRQRPRSQVPKLINTYKYFDENHHMIYVIGGYTNSTYIRRVIIYLQTIKTSFDNIVLLNYVAGINLEANLYGNTQSLSDLFRSELIPMLIYSIYNKDLTLYFKELMKQFHDSINTFLSYSILDSVIYRFNPPKRYSPIDQDQEEIIINIIERTETAMFAENLFLFKTVLLYGVFNKQIHFSVLQEMLNTFQLAFHELADQAMWLE